MLAAGWCRERGRKRFLVVVVSCLSSIAVLSILLQPAPVGPFAAVRGERPPDF